MKREHGIERFVTFADAVVAIAITLLALPLSEVARDERTGAPVNLLVEQLRLDLAPLFGAALSFFVIARLWWAHHQLFAHVVRLTRPLVVANVVWLFTVVLLSASTALVPEYEGPLVAVVYIGTMTLSGSVLTAVAVIVHLSPDVSDDPRVETRRRVIGLAFTTSTFAVAALLGGLVPSVGYLGLLLLFPSGWIEEVVKRRIERRVRPAGEQRRGVR